MYFFNWSFFLITFGRVAGRIPVTLGITIAAFILGFGWSLILGAVQIYKVPVARQLARAYISFIRGTPMLIQLLICNLLLPGIIWRITGYNVGRYWPPIVFVIFAYAFNVAAFLSEILRASLIGVGRGQQEAAYSVGLTEIQSLWYVMLPQALRIALPGMGNSLSGLLKDTSLAFSAAGILDIMGMVSTNATAAFRNSSGAVVSATFREMEGYIGAAIIFFALCILLEQGMQFLSRRLDKGFISPKGG
ncbi:MAG: amino acid ABC transporter permease [Spirochaetaceae bacterium]|jgi:L-cystine transport system permease protein|nr:amino acid ABC transporter permease [Spirochaetaceae bacterium]